jgi:uncharacterized protein (TIGR02284 family)
MPSQSGSCSRKAMLARGGLKVSPREKIKSSRLLRAIQGYMANQKETISTINNLIETLKDGQKGFTEAADAVNDPQLKSLFTGYSEQRSRFASELQAQARSVGETEPETGGSAAGAMHRGWINLKSAITSKDESVILAECERGEDAAVQAFEKAMRDDLPSPVRDIVSRQYSQIKSAHDRIKDLRDAAKKAA